MTVKLAMVQSNPTVGDFPANASSIAAFAREAAENGASLVVFPELALVGYPPRDLLIQEGFLAEVRETAHALARELADGPPVVLGSPWRPPVVSHPEADVFDPDGPITNSLVVLEGGAITHRYDKRLLPTYDIFDEHRYFMPGTAPVVIDVAGVRVGLSICEDLWRGFDAGNERRYLNLPDPVAELVSAGAQLIVNPSASPFVLGKGRLQRELLLSHVRAHGVAVAAVNQVGGNDDLIFDGHACVYVPSGAKDAKLIAAGDGFREQIVYAEIPEDRKSVV